MNRKIKCYRGLYVLIAFTTFRSSEVVNIFSRASLESAISLLFLFSGFMNESVELGEAVLPTNDVAFLGTAQGLEEVDQEGEEEEEEWG